MDVEFGSATHTGNLRKVNEDSLFCDPNSNFFLLADGMGGNARGDLASRLSIDVLKKSLHDGVPPEEAVMAAHHKIITEAKKDASLTGMATTLVVAILKHTKLAIYWVGDSRAYLYRGKTLTQVSRDHSYYQYLLRKGIPEAEAKVHKKSNVVVQSLGLGNPKAELYSDDMLPGDILLLCSDGLTNELGNDRIASELQSASSMQSAADALIEKALEAGGRDNISVICARARGSNHPILKVLGSKRFGLNDQKESFAYYRYIFWGGLAATAFAVIFLAIVSFFKQV